MNLTQQLHVICDQATKLAIEYGKTRALEEMAKEEGFSTETCILNPLVSRVSVELLEVLCNAGAGFNTRDKESGRFLVHEVRTQS